MTLTVAQLYPRCLEVNGDAQNATVLLQRARWAGFESALVTFDEAASPQAASRPGIVVLGSGVDSDLEYLAAQLGEWRDVIAEWIAAGVPVLAVGTGYELLTESIRLDNGDEVRGLGIIPGHAVPRGARVSDDLIVDVAADVLPRGEAREAANGRIRLVGYENHARVIVDKTWAALGSVVHGTGDGDGTDGVWQGNVIATRMHGPVLAKNPALADAILTLALSEAYSSRNPEAQRVDAIAERARTTIATACGLA